MENSDAYGMFMNFKVPSRIPGWPKNILGHISTDDMFVKLSCHPPLGQPTIVPRDAEKVNFHVLLETDAASDRPWEVVVWHNLDKSQEWNECILQETDTTLELLASSRSAVNNTQKRWFSATLPGRPSLNTPVSFTVKFRSGPDKPWKWARDQFSLADGHLYYRCTPDGKECLSHYFHKLNSDLDISTETSDTPDVKLWQLTAPVAAAKGNETGRSIVKLGLPTYFTRWFSLVRLWTPWIAPRHGQVTLNLHEDAILCAFLRHDGTSLVVLAVSGIDDVMTIFRSDDNGNILISSRNDADKPGTSRIIVAVGESFETANAAVMYYARKLVMAHSAVSGQDARKISALTKSIKEKEDPELGPAWLEDWVDGFTFCTWNALGQGITEDNIMSTLDDLRDNNISITNLIVDDGWQSLDKEGASQPSRSWTSFEAKKDGFPKGLKHTATRIRDENPSIRHIGVWHALLGYWGAISPEGEIAKNYKTMEVRKSAGVTGDKWTVVHPDDVQRMYNDFYSFLISCGVDSVKTDAQFSIDELEEAPARKAIIRTYQDAWNIAHLRYLSGRAISCMSQTPQILFHSQLPTNKPHILVRNSDDFFPDVESSHPWHIFCNAHNSLFTQHLNALPDWDMFQTSHPWASFHAAARCVSGGPVYFTDTPGKHDMNLIHQMTAKTTRGNTIILRPSVVGKSSRAYVGYDEESVLHVETFNGMQRTGTGILGLFNVSQRTLTDLVSLTDIPGTENGTYIVRAHTTGMISVPMSRKGHAAFVFLQLEQKGWEILTAYPLREFEIGSGKIQVANLGLLGKMTGAAAIVNTDIYVETTGKLRVWTSLKALGIYGLYVSDLQNRSLENDFMALIFGKPIGLHCVRKSETKDVLEIDLENAWKESDQKAGWSNEVAIEVFVH